MCVLSHSVTTPRTIARQGPLSMGFSRQEYWSGLPFLLQGIFPTQKLNPDLLHCRQILYQLSYEGEPPQKNIYIIIYKYIYNIYKAFLIYKA